MKAILIGLTLVGLTTPACSRISTATANIPSEYKVVEVFSVFPPAKQVVTENARRKKRNKKKETEVVQLPNFGMCSGAFVTDDGYILTARHCIERAIALEVRIYDGTVYRGVSIALSAQHDLALIRIDRRNTPYFALADEAIRGEDISVLGSPLSITNILSKGVIAGLKGDLFHVDCSALPGNSGGPVINSKGEMIGIIVSGFVVYAGTTHLNTAQGPDSIYFFLKEALKEAN